jgi:hypothetical protein
VPLITYKRGKKDKWKRKEVIDMIEEDIIYGRDIVSNFRDVFAGT